MNWQKLLLIVLIFCVAAAAVFYLLPSEEKRIRKQLAILEGLCSKQSDETRLQAVRKVTKIAALFTDPCLIKVERRNFVGELNREEFVGRANMARTGFPQVDARFYDISVELLGKLRASVVMTVRLKGRDGEQYWAETHEVGAGLIKTEGDWLLSEVTLVEVLEK